MFELSSDILVVGKQTHTHDTDTHLNKQNIPFKTLSQQSHTFTQANKKTKQFTQGGWGIVSRKR